MRPDVHWCTQPLLPRLLALLLLPLLLPLLLQSPPLQHGARPKAALGSPSPVRCTPLLLSPLRPDVHWCPLLLPLLLLLLPLLLRLPLLLLLLLLPLLILLLQPPRSPEGGGPAPSPLEECLYRRHAALE